MHVPQDDPPTHFKGKDALGHVIEAQAEGIISAAEVHGLETPGYLSAACDAARESVVLIVFLVLALLFFNIEHFQILAILLVMAFSWMLWKAGRSAWLGWFRLERLHRILEQERWEIENHRQQERDELRVLYAAKGFEGKLLEDVLDVLMSDNERVLKLMVEEELGLSLASQEHPLKQAIGAAAGVVLSSIFCISLFALWSINGIFAGALLATGIASGIAAYLAKNQAIPAIIWNIAIGVLACGCVYFLLQFIHPFSLT